MPSTVVTLRNLVTTRIENLRVAAEFTFNDFDVVQTYIPLIKMDELTVRVWVLGTGFDEQTLTRAKSVQRQIPIQVGLQAAIQDPLDTEVGDVWLELLEELMEAVRGRNVITGFDWQSTEQMKDEQEVPYSFQRLRTELVFESYFIARYLEVSGPPTIGT